MTTESRHQRDDNKLLLAVIAVVVLGAAGIALLAGLTAEVDSPAAESTSQAAIPTAHAIRVDATAPEFQAQERVEPRGDDRQPAPPSAPGVEIDPDVDPALEARRAWDRGDFVVAAAYYTADASRRPDRAYTHYMLGLAEWRSERLDEAAAALRRSAELNPASIRTMINLSRVENDRGDPAAALEAADRALALDGDNAAALYVKGRSLLNLGRRDESITVLEASIAQDVEQAHAHNLLGLIRLEGGAYEVAADSFARAAAAAQEVAYLHVNLGSALELAGRKHEALEAFRAALTLDGDDAATQAVVGRLEEVITAEATAVAVAQRSSAVDPGASADVPVDEVTAPAVGASLGAPVGNPIVGPDSGVN